MIFRPKMERKLFNLLRVASCDQLCLDSVLIDINSSKIIGENQFYKLSVDAFVFSMLDDIYDVSLTARRIVFHDSKNANKTEPKCNVTVREYVKNLAEVVVENKSLTNQNVNNLMLASNLLQDIWSDLQMSGRKLYAVLSQEYELKADDLYAYGYPIFSVYEMRSFEIKVVKVLDLLFERPDRFVMKNISTILAYHLSRKIA